MFISCKWLIMYSVCFVGVCLSIMKFCKQDISRTNSWIFVKFIADIPHILLWKLLTFDADHIGYDF